MLKTTIKHDQTKKIKNKNANRDCETLIIHTGIFVGNFDLIVSTSSFLTAEKKKWENVKIF